MILKPPPAGTDLHRETSENPQFPLDGAGLAAMMDVLNHIGNELDSEIESQTGPLCSDESGDLTEEDLRMESEMIVSGAIVDSWVESSGIIDDSTRLVLQVAPKGRPRDLVIVEAEASLVPDRGWLEDLGENLCHGSPVLAIGQRMLNGF